MRGVIKSIVTRPCSHAVLPNLPPSNLCSSTHCTSAPYAVILSPLAGLPTLIHYPKMSTYLYLAISFTTTSSATLYRPRPQGSSLIQPYSLSRSSPPTFINNLLLTLFTLQAPASVSPSVAALCGGSFGKYLLHM